MITNKIVTRIITRIIIKIAARTAGIMPVKIMFPRIHVPRSGRYAICAAVCQAREAQGESRGLRDVRVNAESRARRGQGERRALRDVRANADCQARRESQARRGRKGSQARRGQGENQVHAALQALRVMYKTVSYHRFYVRA